MPDLPWSKFFWSDWSSDDALKQCSLAAQGLWMRMLCICAKGDPIGYLTIKGNPLDARGVAVAAGVSEDEAAALMAELERWGVFSRDRKGCIYSRRFVKDLNRSAKARKNGKKGGNPSLCKEREKSGSVNLMDKGEDKPQKPEARGQKIEEPYGSLSPDADDAPEEEIISQAVSDYNAAAGVAGWPKVQKLSKQRRSSLRNRLKDCGGIDGWRDALRRARGSPHLCGQNDRGWTADFDFLVTASKFTKLMEGSYDPRQPTGPTAPRGNTRASDAHASLLAGFQWAADQFGSGSQ